MILGLAWMGVANAGVLLAARATLRRVATGRPATDLVLFLLLRFAFIMALVVAAGLSGTLTATGLGAAGGLLLGLLWRRGERFDIPRGRPLPPELPRFLILLGAFLALRSLLLAWFLTPIDGDVTQYHLPKVAEWVRAGSFRAWPPVDPRAWFPASFELVETWWVVFLHHDALVEVAGLEFLLLAAAATWALARWLGLTPESGLLSALTVASVPGLAIQSVSCLNDAPAAALVLAAAALIAARVPFPLLVLVAGISAGLKPTTVYAAPGLLFLWAWLRKEPESPCPSRGASRFLAALGLLLGGFWYVRTWALMGHPLFPMGTPLLEMNGTPLQRLGPSLASLQENVAALVNARIYDARRIYHPVLQYAAGWGPAVVAAGLPALAAMVRWNARLRLLAAAGLLSLTSVLLLVIPDPYNLRFILWFTAIPALAMAAATERARSLRFPAWIAVAVACAGSTFSGMFALPDVKAHIRGGHLEVGSRCVLPVLPEGASFALYGRTSRPYIFYGPDFGTPVREIKADSPEELVAEMIRMDVDLLYAMDMPPQWKAARIVKECRDRRWLRTVTRGVYALAP